MNVRELGEYIREQRTSSRLTLRKLAETAGISFPYLSQIERGVRRPSAEMLQAIAKGLRISAETLYVRAGILEENRDLDLKTQIMKDHSLSERHKQMLVELYETFKAETIRQRRRSAKEKSKTG